MAAVGTCPRRNQVAGLRFDVTNRGVQETRSSTSQLSLGRGLRKGLLDRYRPSQQFRVLSSSPRAVPSVGHVAGRRGIEDDNLVFDRHVRTNPGETTFVPGWDCLRFANACGRRHQSVSTRVSHAAIGTPPSVVGSREIAVGSQRWFVSDSVMVCSCSIRCL